MKDMTLDLDTLREKGGTELAPMSTSEDRSVALKYAASDSPLILCFKTKGLNKGISLKFRSVYPKEEEYLYPPGTYLTLEDVTDEDGYRIITVATSGCSRNL